MKTYRHYDKEIVEERENLITFLQEEVPKLSTFDRFKPLSGKIYTRFAESKILYMENEDYEPICQLPGSLGLVKWVFLLALNDVALAFGMYRLHGIAAWSEPLKALTKGGFLTTSAYFARKEHVPEKLILVQIMQYANSIDDEELLLEAVKANRANRGIYD